MTYFQEWGFQGDPFVTEPLPASDLGRTLLVGRDRELQILRNLLRATARIITVEGPTGVGKTSLANVGAWICYNEHVQDGVGPLFIPCNRSFQLRDESNFDCDEFISGVLLEAAQTLVSRRVELQERGRGGRGLDSLGRWLDSSRISGWQATIGAAGISAGYGRSSGTRTEDSFSRAKFRNEVLTELSEVFPGDGGVVCIIDNLELLQTSAKARSMLEELRDELLHIPGLRWILAGAGGIVEGVVSTPRLDGYLSEPIMVGGIDDIYAGELLRSRREAYARGPKSETYLPLTTRCFTHLYDALAGNLRSTLGRAATYCQNCAMHEKLPSSDEEKERSYAEWLDEHSLKLLEAVDAQITPRAWEVFDLAMSQFDGRFAASAYESFGFNSPQAFSSHLRTLENTGMAASFFGEADRRRKTVEVTPKGRLVHFARQDAPLALDLSDVGV